MARSDPQVNVRISEDLLERLKLAAEVSGKSLTQEISDRLRNSFASTFAEIRLARRIGELEAYQLHRSDALWLVERMKQRGEVPSSEFLAELSALDTEIARVENEIIRLQAESHKEST